MITFGYNPLIYLVLLRLTNLCVYITDEIFKMAAEESQDHQTTGNLDQCMCVCVFLTKNKVS